MNLNFKIRRGKKDSSIILELNSSNSIRVRVTTKLKIPNSSLNYWNKNKCRLKIPNNINNSEIINDTLNEYEKQIMLKFQIYYNSGELNEASAKKLVDEVINPSKKVKEGKNELEQGFTDFIKYYQHYIDIHKTQVSKHTRKMLSKGTLTTYQTSLSVVKRFLKSKNKLAFEEIDNSFMSRLLEYCYKKDYSNNYIGTVISKMGTILGDSFNERYHTNTIFNQSIFNRLTEQVNHVHLSIEEINKIRDLNLEDEKLNNVRDIFIIACHTAMRVGDLVKFLKDEKKIILPNEKRRLIYYIQNKTEKEIYVPIHDDIEAILKKRGGKFPLSMHPNTLNEFIKVIARKAGINEDIVIERTNGGKKSETKKKKYHFVTMHSARRSFCTNADESGLFQEEIMLVSGHSSVKVLESYIKSSKAKRVEKIIGNDFFKTKKTA
jgi:site-specific recombinase XerD